MPFIKCESGCVALAFRYLPAIQDKILVCHGCGQSVDLPHSWGMKAGLSNLTRFNLGALVPLPESF